MQIQFGWKCAKKKSTIGRKEQESMMPSPLFMENI